MSAAELAEARRKGITRLDTLARPDSLAADDSQLGKEAFRTAFSAADRFMKLLFVVVIGFFGIHTFLWFQRGIRPRLRVAQVEVEEDRPWHDRHARHSSIESCPLLLEVAHHPVRRRQTEG